MEKELHEISRVIFANNQLQSFSFRSITRAPFSSIKHFLP